jgi:hypothetical protein
MSVQGIWKQPIFTEKEISILTTYAYMPISKLQGVISNKTAKQIRYKLEYLAKRGKIPYFRSSTSNPLNQSSVSNKKFIMFHIRKLIHKLIDNVAKADHICNQIERLID